jgi:hypothetical protein
MEARESAAESRGETFQKLRGTNPRCEKGAAERWRPFLFVAMDAGRDRAAHRDV